MVDLGCGDPASGRPELPISSPPIGAPRRWLATTGCRSFFALGERYWLQGGILYMETLFKGKSNRTLFAWIFSLQNSRWNHKKHFKEVFFRIPESSDMFRNTDTSLSYHCICIKEVCVQIYQIHHHLSHSKQFKRCFSLELFFFPKLRKKILDWNHSLSSRLRQEWKLAKGKKPRTCDGEDGNEDCVLKRIFWQNDAPRVMWGFYRIFAFGHLKHLVKKPLLVLWIVVDGRGTTWPAAKRGGGKAFEAGRAWTLPRGAKISPSKSHKKS